MSEAFEHVPVLLDETIEALRVRDGGIYLDATIGLAGHGREILRRSAPGGRLIGIDRDAKALARASERLAEFGERVSLVQGNFARFDELVHSINPGNFDGVLADLGVSSMQMDDAERGFSFQRPGPMDMRMDESHPETVSGYLDRVLPEELEDRLREAGEERFSRKVARFLLENHKAWKDTGEMAQAIEKILPRRGKSNPATRVFLALRMAVNAEMESLREFLKKVPGALKPGGRLAIISFHSTEDRIVKRFLEERETGMQTVFRNPVVPGTEEERKNPRSRSAKLRVFEKI